MAGLSGGEADCRLSLLSLMERCPAALSQFTHLLGASDVCQKELAKTSCASKIELNGTLFRGLPGIDVLILSHSGPIQQRCQIYSTLGYC